MEPCKYTLQKKDLLKRNEIEAPFGKLKFISPSLIMALPAIRGNESPRTKSDQSQHAMLQFFPAPLSCVV